MVLAQLLISGILIGGVYALVSLGLTLIFGVMRIVNFAHGDLLMLAMYLAFWGTTLMGVPPYVSLFVIAPLLALLGAAVYWLVIRPAVRKSHEASILATIGLSIIIQNAALMAWSADYRSLHSDFTGAVLEWGALRISVPLLTAFLVA
ncbi:MAG: branched-chain amino acid ABC transporter permease, partial [Alicyclobacillaceae bacterium]|nr:branched-chain amino acid ABC transporter permease [Alicyclobacillaceae bacterium]